MSESKSSNAAKAPATVRAACFDGVVWIRAEGRGNYQSSGPIRKFVQAMIQCGYQHYVVDLAACDHMDSTFMGTLAGLSQNIGTLAQGSLTIINVSPRNIDLLENLGLHLLINVEALGDPQRIPAEVGAVLMELPMMENPEKEIILAAHEALVATNPDNAARFQDVLDYLKQESDTQPAG
jgi:anti-anti-sigma factor